MRVIHELARIARGETPTHVHLRERVAGIAALSLCVDLVATLVIYMFEDGQAEHGIDDLFDAFFWTSTQLLTVSSQLPNPVTVGGRLVDIVLQLYAITIVASLAGSFAAFFHRRSMERESRE
jgi:ion channel